MLATPVYDVQLFISSYFIKRDLDTSLGFPLLTSSIFQALKMLPKYDSLYKTLTFSQLAHVRIRASIRKKSTGLVSIRPLVHSSELQGEKTYLDRPNNVGSWRKPCMKGCDKQASFLEMSTILHGCNGCALKRQRPQGLRPGLLLVTYVPFHSCHCCSPHFSYMM